MSCQSRCLVWPMPEHARSSALVVGHRARMLSSVVFGKTRKAQFTHPRWFIVWTRQARSRSLAKPLAKAARPGASPARGSSIAAALRAGGPSWPKVRCVWSWFVVITVVCTSPRAKGFAELEMAAADPAAPSVRGRREGDQGRKRSLA